jgi:hypothetical protein
MTFGLNQTLVAKSRSLAILGVIILTCWLLPHVSYGRYIGHSLGDCTL